MSIVMISQLKFPLNLHPLQFRKVSNLSHEDSHWAFLTAMNLLAAKVPHIKPSLEAVGLRFNMAHEVCAMLD